MGKYRPVSLKKVKTYTITKRKSKVSLSILATPSSKGDTIQCFISKLPPVLAVNDFVSTVKAIAKETGEFINKAVTNGVKKGYGIGKSVGELISESRFRFKERSIFATAYELDIPATVHIAIGTDIIHMHPDADGCAIGEGSFRDFRLLCSVVSDLDGGVYINLGSAVIMPEVFLKALTVARNLGNRVEDITTVNMDFIQHYRPRENVLKRPTQQKGSAYALTGHHEIMFPLLAAAVIEEMG